MTHRHALALFALALGSPAALAQSTWTGAVNSSWATAGNWSPVGTPTATDDVVIPLAGVAPTITSSTFACAGLTLEPGAFLTLNGGDLEIGTEASPGFLDLQSGPDLSTTAVLNMTSSGSQLTFAGTWTQAAPLGFVGTAGSTVFLGGTFAGPAGPDLKDPEFRSGPMALQTDVPARGRVQVTTGALTGPGWLECRTGSMDLESSTVPVPRVRVDGGGLLMDTVGGLPTVIGELKILSGALGLRDGETPLEVTGELRIVGTMGDPQSFGGGGLFDQGTLRVSGAATIDVPFDPPGTTFILELVDGSSLGGANAQAREIVFASGVTTLTGDYEALKVISTGGAPDAGGWLLVDELNVDLETRGALFPLVRLEGGELLLSLSTGLANRVETLELVSGRLGLDNGATPLEVTGELRVLGELGNPNEVAPGFTTGTLRVSGSATIDVPFDPPSTSFALEFLDGTSLGGADVQANEIVFVDGVTALTGDYEASRVVSTGGVPDAGGWLLVDELNVDLETRGALFPLVRLEGGDLLLSLSTGLANRVETLELVSGRLGLDNSTTPLEVTGDLRILGELGNPNEVAGGFNSGTVRVSGSATIDVPFDPPSTSFALEFLDGTSLGGADVQANEIVFVDGVTALTGDYEASRVVSTGGVPDAGGWLLVDELNVDLETRGALFPLVRLEGGDLLLSLSTGLANRVETLELVSGRLGLDNSTTPLEVTGDLRILGELGNPNEVAGGFNSGTVRVSGSATIDVPFDPPSTSFALEFLDGTSLGGADVQANEIVFVDGVTALTGDYEASRVVSTGGVPDAGGWLLVDELNVDLETRGALFPLVRLEGGDLLLSLSTGLANRVETLELVSGRLGLDNGATPLEVTGELRVLGELGNPNEVAGGFTTGTLQVSGAATISTPFAPPSTDFTIEFVGNGTLGGPDAQLWKVALTSGERELVSDVSVLAELASRGGTSVGQGAWVLPGTPGNPTDLDTAGNELHRIRVIGEGVESRAFFDGIENQPSRVARVDVEGGLLRAGGLAGAGTSQASLLVTEELRLVSGSLGISNGTAGLEVSGSVIVEGELTSDSGGWTTGTLRVDGAWTGNAPFTAGGLTAEFTTGSSVEGSFAVFERLRVDGDVVFDGADVRVTENFTLEDGAALTVQSGALELEQSTYQPFFGRLELGPGGALRLPADMSMVPQVGFELALLGTPDAPAVIEPLDAPGAAVSVHGPLEAVHFRVAGLHTFGLALQPSCTIGPAGFRDGVFDSGEGGPGATLLSAATSTAFTASNIAFEDSLGVQPFNVSRSSGPPITILNYFGAVGGPDFENDTGTSTQLPEGFIQWVDSTAPDLRPAGIAGPVKAVGGDDVVVAWEAVNQGGGDATGGWTELLVLSPDTVIDAGDMLLATVVESGSLVSGGALMRSATVTMPEGLDGEFYFGVILDSGNTVAEPGAEENNATFQLPAVVVTPEPRPDVVASGVLPPLTGEEGEAISVSWTVANIGTGVAEPGPQAGAAVLSESLFLSVDGTLSGNDLFLGSFDTPGGQLAVDAELMRTEDVVLPDGLSGPYRILVRADSQNAVDEGLQEGNNLAASLPFTVEQLDLPNLAVAQVGVVGEFEALFGGSGATATVAVDNLDPDASGKGTANGFWFDRVWLSSDTVVGGGDQLLANRVFSGVLAPEQGYAFDVPFTLPSEQTQSTWYLLVELDRNGTLNETDDADNLFVASFEVFGTPYLATVETKFEEGLSSTAPGEVLVSLTGQALDRVTGLPFPGPVDVSVRLRHKGTRRVFDVTTEADGTYAFVFEPFQGEAGRFDVYADHPAVFEDPLQDLQDEFLLFDLKASPASVTSTLSVGEFRTGTLTVWNPGDTPVVGVARQIGGVPAYLDFQLEDLPTVLAPGEVRSLLWSLEAVGESPDPAQAAAIEVGLELAVLGVQEPVREVAFPTFVSPFSVDLVATENALFQGDGSFTKVPVGEASSFSIAIRNEGGKTATGLTYRVPNEALPGVADPATVGQPFFFVPVTPKDLGDLAPGETRIVEVGFVPASNLLIGTTIQSLNLNQQIRIEDDAGDQVYYPYQLIADSTAEGDLVLTVVDQFAFFDEFGMPISPPQPGLAGAEVRFARYNDPDTVYTGVSDAFGAVDLFDAFGSNVGTRVLEGTYELSITAVDHESFDAVIPISAGQTFPLLALLKFQSITYSFDVEPTDVEDEYDIELEVDFEVEVPAPVVLVDPGWFELDMALGQSLQVDLTITNYGLVGAKGLELFMDDLQAFDVQTLVTDLGDLPGTPVGSVPASVTVPVSITRVSNDFPCSYSVSWGVRYYVETPDYLSWDWTPIFYSAPVDECGPSFSPPGPQGPLPPSPDGPDGGDGGPGEPPGNGGGGGGGGGGSSGSPSVTPPPDINIPAGCQPS